MEDLKPCPHCGSSCVVMTSEIVTVPSLIAGIDDMQERLFEAVCQNAYCGVGTSDTPEEAAVWWNSRK